MKFVYFDLGNVLVNFDHQLAVSQIADLSGKPAELVQQVAFESGLQNQFETGQVDEAEYAAQINKRLETTLPVQELLDATSAIFELNEPILPVLEYLAQAEIPMAILSNTCSAHWNWIARQNWPVPGDWFRFHVLSYEVHSMKPDSRIYEVCEERAERLADQLFFTDDKAENIEAADQRGWMTHPFVTAHDLQSALEEWLEG